MRSVRIEELVVRIPGLSPQDARTLGEQVAARVGARLAAQPLEELQLGGLDLRLTLPRGAAVGDLVDPIANAILARLT